jgi:uncharacterized surface protein with fasciclin (FAS1) repeats
MAVAQMEIAEIPKDRLIRTQPARWWDWRHSASTVKQGGIMKPTFIFALAAILAGGAIFAPASAGAPGITRQEDERTLAGALAAEPSLTTFARLVRAAGLEDMLRQDGPFTILAPNDAAFRVMPKSDLEGLLEPENRDRLVQMLTYHIVPGSITLSSISTEEYVTVRKW